MKKILIGILILIPIIILLVVALVSNLIQMQVWIAVEDMTLTHKGTDREVSNLALYLDVRDDTVYDLDEWVDVSVLPAKANNYTVEWSISNVVCTDDEYQKQYEDYLADPVGVPVHPAATLVDGAGRDAELNTSGEFKINAYCSFNVSVRAETVTKHFLVDIVGNTVHSVALTDLNGGAYAEMTVGESMRLCASYVPVDSIITKLEYGSSAPNVAYVDENGTLNALSEGEAEISVTADRYDGQGTVTSNVYKVVVRAGASRYGDKITLARVNGGKYGFDELGISAGDADEAAGDGYTVEADGIVINGESASIALKNGKTLQVELCNADDIAIEHAELYSEQSGYVLGVGEKRGLALAVRYAATADTRTPSGAVWSSENEEVATVTGDGYVQGVAEGTAVITARLGASSASITLNVRTKATSLRLKTSDEALEAGLARQTVFASEKYVFETDAEVGENEDKYAKQPNGVDIRIQGEPDDATEEELAAFYAHYALEIVEGGEYASVDEANGMRVKFNSAALEGKGVVQVKVRAYAKYPRFEANQKHTSDSVTLNVVYGVEASTADHITRAGEDQKAYIMRPEILDTPAQTEATLTAPNGQDYYVFNGATFKSNYAIALAADIACPKDQLVDLYEDYGWCVHLYGNLYGNSHIISAKPNQLKDDNGNGYLVHVGASGVTVSNVIIRHEDTVIDKLDGSTFEKSYCMTFDARGDELFGDRLLNERAEYCIFENSYGGVDFKNTDATVVGCITRNISSVGLYFNSAHVNEGTNGLIFSRMKLHNSVFSSIIGPSLSISFEKLSILDGSGMGRFSTAEGKDESREESYKWVEENLVPRRYVHCLDQTGFLDIYNWQNSTNVTLVETGKKLTNDLIAQLTEPLIKYHPDFRQCVVSYDDAEYFHLGFISSGISFDTALDERTFQQITLEDKRFTMLKTKTLSSDAPGLSTSLKNTIKNIINKIEATLYCYKNDSSLTPASTYELNSKLIDHLHEGRSV